ncbi:c-type cytochrome [Thiobacillus sp. 63-78]|uniref:c-type cytochrome n=1 Tax=Thiobacillus sp. 63-78 TaxID=1895859 RepID=UPI0025D63742|nr:c-type cytochrome [Thiobacillus sp. 63-78]
MSIALRAQALLGIALAVAAGGAIAKGELTGDPKAGEAVYARCFACHALTYNRTGPKHCGLLGRRAGSVPGFQYSVAMKRANWIWDKKMLDRFLANPMKVVPGTTMGYAGVKDRKERADLIAYLEQAGKSDVCREH